MILSDSVILKEIENGNIIIEPFQRELLNPNSVDLTLGNVLKVYPREYKTDVKGNIYVVPLDVKKKQHTIDIVMDDRGYTLYPGEIYLYACNEKIGVKGNICAQICAKSSGGRLGLDIVVGPAGFIDSGFEGSLVLELRATRPIIVYPNMKICQIKYERVEGDVLESYDKKSGSKYMNQTGVQESLMYKNFK